MNEDILNVLVLIGIFSLVFVASVGVYNYVEDNHPIVVAPNIVIEPAKPIERQVIIVTLPTTQVIESDPLEVGNWVQKQDSGILEKLIFEKVNSERTERKLHALKHSEKLQVAARLHAQDMASRNYVSHISPEGLGPSDREKCYDEAMPIFKKQIMENIVMLNTWQGVEKTVSDAVYGWMQSDDHKKTMLDRHSFNSGIGVAIDDNGQAYVVQMFCN